MTSALEILCYIVCTSHGVVMMSVSHFHVSQRFGDSLSHSYYIDFNKCFVSSPYDFCLWYSPM